MMWLPAALLPLAFVLLPQTATDEDVLRGLVRQYYDAQTNKDVDKALGFWSTAANPRMSREGFVTLFGAGEARYTVGIESVSIRNDEARVRVALEVERTIVRDNVPTVIRQSLVNSELWRREGTSWKLLREGSIAEDLADDLLAAPPADRLGMTAGNSPEINRALRYVLAQRASMLAATTAQYARAREIFELVLALARATNDRRSESETLQNIANAYYFLKSYQDATDFYQQRLALSREMADDEAAAASLLGLATVAYAQAEYTPAVTSFREALAIYEKRDEGASIGRTLVSIGNVQYLQADYDAASASYRRALDLLVAGMDPQGAAFARRGLGRVFAAQGDVASALDTYGQILADARALTVVNPKSSTDVATALESIGELHFRLGNTDQARAAFDEARRLSDRDLEAAGRLLGSLGLTELVAGRFDAALANYTDSRTRFEQGKMPEGVARAWVGIGFSQTAREKFADAMAAYRTAIKMFDDQNDNEGSARAWLGLSLAQSGTTDHAAALESAQHVKTIAERIKSADLSWRANVRVGEALRKLARLEDARKSFEDAIVTIDHLAADVPIDPGTRAQLDDSASAWTGLAFTLAAQGDPAAALAAAESRRAHIRRVQLGGFQRDITRGATPEEQADEQGIVRDLISTRAQVRAERNASRPDAARLARLEQQLGTLVARRADQQSRLYARLPELQQWRGLGPSSPVDLNALVTDSRSLAIEYLLSDDELLVLTVAHGETAPDVAATAVAGSRRDLAEKIAQAMQPAVLGNAAEWRKRSAPIAAFVLNPISARLEARDRAIIVPDDLLWKVPFEALPAGDGELAAVTYVTYATSLATLALEHRIAASQPTPDRIVAGIVAAPEIPAAIRTQLTLTQQGWKAPDAEIALAAAHEIAKTYGDGATLRTGTEATEAAARALIESSDVLHISAPLLMSGPTPLFSSLLLGGAPADKDEGVKNDGRWETREWFGVTGRTRVAVLADASSFGAAGVGGSMDALAWAAAAAGVPALVIARWPADGFASAAVLAAFHAQMAKGSPPAEAWRNAITAARTKPGGAPADWAGLRLIGGGS
jgi:tetratricopeptide (TPR) repeat protein/CHAT domain-containing protein